MSAARASSTLLSEFCRMRSPVRSAAAMGGAAASSPCRTAMANVKRDLFGPVEKDEFKRFFDSELRKHQQRASDRWGFNFARGHPLAEPLPNQQYLWERVPPTAIATATMPAMYTLSHAAHQRPNVSPATYVGNRNGNRHTSRHSIRQHHHHHHIEHQLPHTPRRGRQSAAAAAAASVAASAAAAFLSYDDPLLEERARRANEYNARLTFDDSGDCSGHTDCDDDLLNSSSDSANHSATSTSPASPPTPRSSIKTRLSLVITAANVTGNASTSSAALGSENADSGSSMPTLRASTRKQRQPRITDYLKERKRLTATPKKVSPTAASKRTRLNTSLSRVSA